MSKSLNLEWQTAKITQIFKKPAILWQRIVRTSHQTLTWVSTFESGEPHLQDEIRREELDGERRDAAEERPYPEDPSDWPAPHQITDTFRQDMTKTWPLKCPDGPYSRSEARNRRFSKAYFYPLFSNWERIELDWFVIFQESIMK